MNQNPQKFDLLRIAGLRPKIKSEEEKRYPSFNTRMLAATIDLLLLSIFLAPLVDYFFVARHGPPPIDMGEFMQLFSSYVKSGESSDVFMQEMRESGYMQYWFSQMSWQVYAMMIYACVCWHFWSATPGKMLFRLVIIDHKTENRMGDWQSILRLFGYIASALPFGLGFIWMGIDKKKRGWHDLIASTRVVKKSSLKPVTTSATEAAHPSNSPAPSTGE